MKIVIEFIFRLRIVYVCLGLENALRMKQKMEKISSRINQILVFLFFLYVRNIYISLLVTCCILFLSIFYRKKTLSGGKLIQKLQESRTFGNWKSTTHRIHSILWFLICFHIFYGPFLF
jgi:hypothetical protein